MAATPTAPSAQRWPVQDVLALFNLPFNDLMFRAQQVHRDHFNANEVQVVFDQQNLHGLGQKKSGWEI